MRNPRHQDLPDELAHQLWQGLKGVYDRNAGRVLAFESDGRANGVKMVEEVEAELGEPAWTT